jgi:8-oxo-dGTP diphosphatase
MKTSTGTKEHAVSTTRLLYGTGNSAKLTAMRGYLRGLGPGFRIDGPDEAGIILPDVPEDGITPLENARAKATAYYNAFRIPVFAADSGLYFDGIPDELQPGVHVRRVGGRRLGDAEMTDYYAGLAARFGGRLVCRYINAICLVTENGVYEHMGGDISGKPFIICGKPHPKRVEGFPLDCLSLRIDTGTYYYDDEKLEDDMIDLEVANGFCRFFKNALNFNV